MQIAYRALRQRRTVECCRPRETHSAPLDAMRPLPVKVKGNCLQDTWSVYSAVCDSKALNTIPEVHIS